jgi:HEXXH motif-containing protein
VDAHTILWTDTDLYRQRHEKTATALMAVQHALRLRRPLKGAEDEFLALYADLAAAPPETFTTIWEDPFSYFWARIAYELTAWCLNPGPLPDVLASYCASLGTGEPHRALALHLEEFKKCVIALDLIAGAPRRFERPLQTTLPFSIPGTRFSIVGKGAIEVLGSNGVMVEVLYNGESLHLRTAAAAADPYLPRLVECPLLEDKDLEVKLKPETFNLPGLDAAHGFSGLPEDYQQQQIELLREALILLERHQPAALEHLRELVQVIALKPPAADKYSNVSFSDLPGAFILSAVRHPYWIADGLIHEFLHNRLFFILDAGEILEGERESAERSDFYSPWRDDLRSPSGLLHAVYVYIGVGKFWHAVCASGETAGLERQYVEDQAVRAVLQLKIGIAQLRRHATFTHIGIGLFRELEREVDRLAASMRQMNLSPSAPGTMARGDGQLVPLALGDDGRPLSILQSIQLHAEKFDRHRQCANLGAILNLD